MCLPETVVGGHCDRTRHSRLAEAARPRPYGGTLLRWRSCRVANATHRRGEWFFTTARLNRSWDRIGPASDVALASRSRSFCCDHRTLADLTGRLVCETSSPLGAMLANGHGNTVRATPVRDECHDQTAQTPKRCCSHGLLPTPRLHGSGDGIHQSAATHGCCSPTRGTEPPDWRS